MYEIIFLAVSTAITTAVSSIIKRLIENHEWGKRKNKNNSIETITPLLNSEIKNHPLIVEHHFRKFLKYKITNPEIESILSSKSPLYLFDLYKTAKKFTHHENGNFFFKESYNTDFLRKKFNKNGNMYYYFYSFIGFMLLLYSDVIINNIGFQYFPVIAVMILICIPYAFHNINKTFDLKLAEQFIEYTKPNASEKIETQENINIPTKSQVKKSIGYLKNFLRNLSNHKKPIIPD